MIDWNYSSNIEKSSGYEDVLDVLKSYTPEDYNKSDEVTKLRMVNEVFEIYRSKNIYPITYYNEDGIIKEINDCVKKDVCFDGKTIDFKFLQGNNLCRFLFRNLERVCVGDSKDNSMYDRFYNDHKLKRAIELCLRYETPRPIGILGTLRLIGGGVATNFHAMKAKAIYERYCPDEAIIYDYACGFGGRILGALSSKNNYKYFGVEPNSETFYYLNQLGKYIEKATSREGIFKIYNKTSEEFRVKEKYCDFAFSSPPYFNLEKYCDEPTQCYNKFTTIESWIEGYVRPTISNIYYMLKPNRFYAVNIADFNYQSKRVELVKTWKEISVECGFSFYEEIKMKVQTRRGVGHKNNDGTDKNKTEGIYVFKK